MYHPNTSEYPPYFHRYIKLVPDEDIVFVLEEQLEKTVRLLDSFSEEVSRFRYAKDKWSIKEVIGHIIDTERIFSYRALRFARNDPAHLHGFDQDTYVQASGYNDRALVDIRDEYMTVRNATISLIRSFDEESLQRVGKTSDYSISVRSIPFILAGHEIHHRSVIENLYLNRSSSQL